MNEDKVITVGKYQVKIIRSLCIGAATCIAVAPNIFEMDSEKKAVFKEGGMDTPENVLMAAQACPVKAVVVTDIETGAQVWPI